MDFEEGVELFGEGLAEGALQLVLISVFRENGEDDKLLHPFPSGLHRHRRRFVNRWMVFEDSLEFK